MQTEAIRMEAKNKKPLTDEQKANMRNYGRSVYKERSEQGICTRCGKRKAAPGRKNASCA